MITRGEFKQMLTERTLLLDGGYGTNFLDMGLGGGPPETLNIDHPKKVEGMHAAYADAGADILLTNTFGANRIKLAENSLEKKIEEINFSAVEIARRAAKPSRRRVLIFGDMSSTGNLPRPSGEGSWNDCLKAFEEQAHLLLDAGVDGLIVETMTDIKELKAAVIAIRRISAKVPLIAHMAFDASGTTLTGASIEVCAAVMNDLDVDVLGMNCLLGPQDMIPNIRRMASATDRFLSAEPNAGAPFFNGKRTLYRTDPLEFSLFAEEMVEAGASIVGGCCGTTPDHIRAISAILKGVAPASRRARDFKPSAVLASRTAVIDAGAGFCVIGERINPTGRKRLRNSMREGDWSVMTEEAAVQGLEGAHVLDVNFGIEKFFTAENISDAVVSLDSATSLPLSLDIQSADLMECAMAEYPGRALINSCTCDEEALSVKLPLLKKYGGVMVLLAMDSSIPDTADGRVAAVERALEYASGLGLGEDRFIIDPLVMPHGAGGDCAVTLETIRLCALRGLRTAIGLSNLSHGMPNRAGINAAFLARAIELGLSSAILNTGDAVVMKTLFGALLLKGISLGEGDGENPLGDPADPLAEALLSGRSSVAVSLVDDKLASGMLPPDVSQNFLGAAMERIGALYEAKKIFLPHILFAAETSYPIFDRLNEMMDSDSPSRGLVMLATVEGDIHDIGKNIVAVVLRSGGFEVIDIGKNVPSDEIIAQARERRPDIIGLSAMMTSTVGRIGEVASALKEEWLDITVISGGASMNGELAATYGVLYAKDSVEALSACKKIVEATGRNT